MSNPQFEQTGSILFPIFWLTDSIPFAKIKHNGDVYEIHIINGARLVVIKDLVVGMKATDGEVTTLEVYARFNSGDFLKNLVKKL